MDVRRQFLDLSNRLLDQDDWYNFYAKMVAYSVMGKLCYDIRSRELMGWEHNDTYEVVFMTYSAPIDDNDPFINFELENNTSCEKLDVYFAIFIKNSDTHRYALVRNERIWNDDTQEGVEEFVATTIQDFTYGDVEEILEDEPLEFKKIGG